MAKWKLVKDWKQKRQGQVWIVEDQTGRRGYFKFARKSQWYFSGPVIANEYISAALARKLGFPVADMEMASVLGPDGRKQKGMVSVSADAPEVITWREAGKNVHDNPEKYVNQVELLAQLLVFDAWVINIDRAKGKNLILYRYRPAERYDWYLIDHGLTLYGSPRKWKRWQWKSPRWERLWLFYHVPKGLLRLQSSYRTLRPMIQKIRSLTEEDIDEAINTVPQGYLRNRERNIIKRLLLYRQKRLGRIIKRWLKHNGIKEYGAKQR